MKLIFPFQYVTTNIFGRIYRPYARIQVFKKDLQRYVERILVVDTGADFTIFPRKDAYWLGIDLEKETIPQETFGIGGKEKIYLYKNLRVKLGNKELLILELFKVSLEEHKTIFETP